MFIYDYSLKNLAILNDKTSYYYLNDGSIDLELMHTLIEAYDQSGHDYDGISYLYYTFKTPLNTDKGIANVLRFWDIQFSKHQDLFDSLYRYHLSVLDGHDVMFHEHVSWLSKQSLPSNTGKFPSGLIALGLHTYLIQGHKYQVSPMHYCPDQLLKATSLEALNFGMRNPEIDYKKILEHAPAESVSFKKFIATAGFSALFTTKTDAKLYNVSSAIEQMWPYLEQFNVSLADILPELKKITKGKSFSSDLLTWSQSDAAALYPGALRGVRSALDQELKKLLSTATKWSPTELGWAKMLSTLSPDEPFYAETRNRIADVIVAAHRSPGSHKTLMSLSIYESFQMALRSGSATFMEMLNLWDRQSSFRIHELMVELFTSTPTIELEKIYGHPIFQQKFNTSQLFNHLYTPHDPENGFDYDDLYETYMRVSINPESAPDLLIEGSMETVIQLYLALNTGKTLQESVTPEMYIHLWAFMGFQMYVATESKAELGDAFSSDTISSEIPKVLTWMMKLDPAFYRSHRADILQIITSNDKEKHREIYRSFLIELFGPVVCERGIHELTIRDGRSVEAFFAQLYLQQHPELGYTTQPAIAIDDLFDL